MTDIPPPIEGRTYRQRVVGVTFVDGYPDNLYRLDEIASEYFGPKAQHPDEIFVGWGPDDVEPLAAVLVRNPENPHDSNAIEVHVPALATEHTSGMIGHLPRQAAARLAPILDSGQKVRSGVQSVMIHPDNPSNPGIIILVQVLTDEEGS